MIGMVGVEDVRSTLIAVLVAGIATSALRRVFVHCS
jgi:hypothetical protein